jgi:hypothetical protein
MIEWRETVGTQESEKRPKAAEIANGRGNAA